MEENQKIVDVLDLLTRGGRLRKNWKINECVGGKNLLTQWVTEEENRKIVRQTVEEKRRWKTS